MSRIKTIIVDDEKLARNRIRKLLDMDDDIHLVEEFDQGQKAIDFIENYHVDLVFLDIHMPEVYGFAVIQKLPEKIRPFIIFATADKESAIKAFEYKALDYLLKPFRNQRFFQALENAKKYVQIKNKAELSDKFADLLDHYQKPKVQKIAINSNQKIDFDDIIYIKSDGNYLKLYHDKSDYEHVRKTMNELNNELDEDNFLKIHRSIIVNKYFIKKIDYIGNNEYELCLNSDIKLKSSRSFKDQIELFLEN